MNKKKQRNKPLVVKQESEPSPYAGKPLNSEKEIAARKFAPTAMEILKRVRAAK